MSLDDLTRLPARNAFFHAVHAAVERARAHDRPVSLLVIDVDHFKLVNDTFGHLQGDDVLVRIAELLRRTLRGADMPGRWAGDEFVALLPDTPLDGARLVAERFAATVRSHHFPLRSGDATVPVTVSVGVATFPMHAGDGEALVAAADRALYHVKRDGRDGVAVVALEGERPAPRPLAIDRFVGRVTELRALTTYLESAALGDPRVVALVGEAGIGKSALLRRLEPEVRLRAGSLVFGRCQEADARPPYAPWADVIGAIHRLDRNEPRRWLELPMLVPELGASVPPEARAPSKYVLLEEIAEYIRAAARERALVIVLDDMQWADSASWDVLEYLLPQLAGERLLLCMTIRSEETRGETLERRRRLSRNERFHELTLSRLTREELKQWVGAAFHGQDVGRELLAFLHRHTEGNPFFVAQVLRTLVDEGAVWHDGEHWAWRPVSALRLPVAIHDLVSRRLSRLTSRAHAVLTTCAVIGAEFDVDLAIAAGAGTEAELLDAIDEGVAHSVLAASKARGGDRWAFTHGLIAEVLRESANPRRRKRIHERVANALVLHAPEHAAEIAMHFDRGGDPEQAYRWALAAAERATKVNAHQEAVEFIRTAERNASSAEQLAEVRVRLAESMEALGRYDEAEELTHLAIEWYETQGGLRERIALRRRQERLRVLLGQPAQRTLESCRALAAEARRHEFAAEEVPLLQMIAAAHDRLGEHDAARAAAEEAVSIAERVDDPLVLAAALNRLGSVVRPTDIPLATGYFARALGIYEAAGNAVGQAKTHSNIGACAVAASDFATAQREFTTALGLSRAVGMPEPWGLAALNLGVVYLRWGHHAEARDLFGEALALFAQLKHSERQLYTLYNLAHLDRENGAMEAAAELYDVASSLARRIGQSDVEIGGLAGRGLALLALDRTDEARGVHATMEPLILARSDWFQGREFAEALRIRVLWREGRREEALAHLDATLPKAEAADVYTAAWLAAECAELFASIDRAGCDGRLDRYGRLMEELGFETISRRCRELAGRA